MDSNTSVPDDSVNTNYVSDDRNLYIDDIARNYIMEYQKLVARLDLTPRGEEVTLTLVMIFHNIGELIVYGYHDKFSDIAYESCKVRVRELER
jgi:hypothetical protein